MNIKTLIVALAIALLTQQANAQAYKCIVNGKTVYADHPCAADARSVGALQDQLTEDQQIQRLRQSIKERKERNNIESHQNAEFEAKQRALYQQAASEAAQAEAARSAQQRRCTSLQDDMKWNQRGVARYQDFGWQKSLTQQEQELKRNRDEYERNCR